VAASSLAFSEYMFRILPADYLPQEIELGRKALAIAIILVFTFIHYYGLRSGSKVQDILTVLKIGLISLLLFTGFAFGEGSLEHFLPKNGAAFPDANPKTIGLALMWIMFAYSGWNASAYIGSEILDPKRTLPRSLLVGTGTVLLLYFSLNLLFVYSATPSEMSGIIAIGGLAAGNLFGESVQSLISLLISFALLSSISAFIILGPRVYYAMARDGHFFKIAGDVHPVFRTPTKSILLQCLIAAIMVMTGTFDQILTYLARYVHRVAISNSRVVNVDQGQVSFRYQDSDTSKWHIMSLPAQEFIRRFLQHVLPN